MKPLGPDVKLVVAQISRPLRSAAKFVVALISGPLRPTAIVWVNLGSLHSRRLIWPNAQSCFHLGSPLLKSGEIRKFMGEFEKLCFQQLQAYELDHIRV